MSAADGTSAPAFQLLPLKPFQQRASDTALRVILDTAAKIEADPARRRAVALAQGVTLLRSPTGSGKTLTIGRTLERAAGALPRKAVWFWFTPYSGLVRQSRDALAAQCPGLRLRDLATDRLPRGTRDGDVFVMTWASVASATKEAKLARQEGELLPSIDLLVAALRADGWLIGAVIDEGHLNFGTNARQAADFYLGVLQPDVTMIATATPRDEQLERFERVAGIGRVNRIEVSRDDAVRACLNKPGVKAVHFRPDERDASLLDMEEVAVVAGLARHRIIRKALADAGVAMVPLLMIQVDNDARDKVDPVAKVRDILVANGMDRDAIAAHTSGEPDPYFHTLAYDETKEVLIFKVAAATGFDAPRAWTLVSLRKAIGVEFGLQVLGRIMRVDPRVQHLHAFACDPPRPPDGVLDYGYVFLANPAQQVGIASAADELKTIRDSIETVTDNVVVVEFGGSRVALVNPDGGFAELLDPPAPGGGEAAGTDDPAGRVRAAALRVQGSLDMALHDARRPSGSAPGFGGRAHQTVEEGWGLAVQDAPAVAARRLGRVSYPLRADLRFPRALAREVMPRSMDGLVQGIARRIRIDDGAIALVNRTMGKVLVTEEDVFEAARTTERANVPLSNLRIAQQAQMAFRFNESIDDRDLKPALLERLRRELDDRGHAVPGERDLRRAVDLLAMARPDLLHDACRACLAQVVEIRQDEEIPAFYEGPDLLERADKGLYGVFPADLNEEEFAFARLLDQDQTGTVLWWLRNVENARWAVTIVLPNGRRHFPDFVVGIDARRKSRDGIALAEVKDDGRTGRLFSTVNTDKVRTEHREYRSALMVFRNDRGQWFNVAYRADLRMHQPGSQFTIDDLVWTQQ